MRKVKFRGFGVHDKKWFYGYIDNRGGEMVIRNYSTEWRHEPFLHGKNIYHADKVVEKSIGQWTGLKDKNGTDIYEGDILTDHGEEGPLYIEYSNEHAAFVFVDKFDHFGITFYTTNDISYGGFEVIGNIYENLELLQGETE